MNEEKSPPESDPAASSPAPAAPATRRWSWRAAFVLVLVALAAANVYLAQRLEVTREELARRLADGERALREADQSHRQDREALEALKAKLATLAARIDEMQSEQQALAALYQEFSRASDERLLVEIEQALTLAQQQLAYAGNVPLAIAALEAVEARLAQSGQARFAGLRQQIVRDLERLRAHPAADWTGLSARLDALAEQVPALPLAFEQRVTPAKATPKSAPPEPAPTAASWWAPLLALGAEIGREFSQLVRIERLDRPDPGLLAPSQAYFLRENLRLRLLSARLALIARDGATFRRDLEAAESWLARYFDPEHAAVQEMRTQLRRLKSVDVGHASLALDETLAIVRKLKLSRTGGGR